jgi:branched-chain amino acid transport system ATP-binding protein
MTFFSVSDLTLQFGGLFAVKGVSFDVKSKEIVSLVGPNGAGKTSIFNVISGIYKPTSGSIKLQGIEVVRIIRRREYVYSVLFASLIGMLGVITVSLQKFWEILVLNRYTYLQKYEFLVGVQEVIYYFFVEQRLLTAIIFIVFSSIALLSSLFTLHSTKIRPEVAASIGISRTFQNIRLFPDLTVEENLLIGMEKTFKTSILQDLFWRPKARREQQAAQERVIELLSLVELEKHRLKRADELSYGLQRKLEIARALSTDPKLLLLDEPAAGMNYAEIEDLGNIIKKIQAWGITVLLIEHHMKFVMKISDRVIVINFGSKIAEGVPEEVRNNPKVIEAYLGHSVNVI